MRVKICGITNIAQGIEIASVGATSIGFICVESSPRYVTPQQIKAIAEQLPTTVDQVGVFANHGATKIKDVVETAGLTSVQLHGQESTDFCLQLRQLLGSDIELIKAFRIKSADSLAQTAVYQDCVDTLLLDAYDPKLLGGTGKTIDWQDLVQFKPLLPWMLAGGLTPDNVSEAISRLHPDGIDLSSGVERSPGDKDLAKVAQLFQVINEYHQN
ncbi:MAG: phosphoribosylanthranilate isomerase [Cyanobacteria bacterium P01_A01_bin.83]